MFLHFFNPGMFALKIFATIFFTLLLVALFQTSVLAADTIFSKLQLPAIFFKSEQAFTSYLQAEEQKILAKINHAVCINDNTPLPLPTQEEVFPYIERAKITEFTDKEQAYAIFIKFYLDFCINKRIEQEACVANNACKQELCAGDSQATPNNMEHQADPATSANQTESSRNLEEVYDINARDLIAIP